MKVTVPLIIGAIMLCDTVGERGVVPSIAGSSQGVTGVQSGYADKIQGIIASVPNEVMQEIPGSVIQDMINSTPEGGRIEIPEGLFIVTEALIPKQGQHITGQGSKTVIQLGDNVNQPVFIVNQDDIQIGHVHIHGNRAKQTQEYSTSVRPGKGQYETSNGINVDGGNGGCKNILLYDLVVASCISAGICTERGAREIKIYRVTLKGNAFDGLAGCETTGVRVEDPILIDNDAAGLSLDHLCGDYVIINPQIYGNGDMAVYGRALRNIYFQGGFIAGGVEISRNFARDDGESLGVTFQKTLVIGEKNFKDNSEVVDNSIPVEDARAAYPGNTGSE